MISTSATKRYTVGGEFVGIAALDGGRSSRSLAPPSLFYRVSFHEALPSDRPPRDDLAQLVSSHRASCEERPRGHVVTGCGGPRTAYEVRARTGRHHLHRMVQGGRAGHGNSLGRRSGVDGGHARPPVAQLGVDDGDRAESGAAVRSLEATRAIRLSHCDSQVASTTRSASSRGAEQRSCVRGRCGHGCDAGRDGAFRPSTRPRPGCASSGSGAGLRASVLHSLWEALRREGVPLPVLRGLQGRHRAGTAQGLLSGSSGRPLAISRGIAPRISAARSCPGASQTSLATRSSRSLGSSGRLRPA